MALWMHCRLTRRCCAGMLHTWRLPAGCGGILSCSGSRLRSVGSTPQLQQLWDRPLTEVGTPLASGSSSYRGPSAASLRKQFENAHHWNMRKILGDPSAETPPSGRHVFICCGVIETIFLCVNAATLSPFIFEIAMPYHLKYTALVIGWWGGVYWGLNIAQYGPFADGIFVVARTVVGLVLFSCGVAGLILADGTSSMGPWPSYWLLICSYSGMVAFDMLLHRNQMIPLWLLKWKMGLSFIIVMSLLLGVLKGGYLERNATRLIMESSEFDE